MFRMCRRRPCRNMCRNIESITIEELKEIIKNNSNAILLDVRSKQEYNEGHLNRQYKYSSLWLMQKCKKYLRLSKYNYSIL